MRRGRRAAFASIGAAVVVVAAVSGAGANRLDDTLRTNQVQVLATHNSYHIQQDVPIAASPTTQYTHAPLDQQLDLGVRGFEIDVVNAPDGQFPVLHTPVVDNTSNCTPLAQCLEITRTWSKAHPGHVPIFILLEPKDDPIDFVIDPTLRPFDAAGLDQLDAVVRKSLGRQLITPDSVRGKAKTLRAAVTGRDIEISIRPENQVAGPVEIECLSNETLAPRPLQIETRAGICDAGIVRRPVEPSDDSMA